MSYQANPLQPCTRSENYQNKLFKAMSLICLGHSLKENH